MLRQMLTISQTERITNVEVIEISEGVRKLLKEIKKKRNTVIGHILIGQGILKTIIERKIEWRNPSGQRDYSI